jgi:hypothetical protein
MTTSGSTSFSTTTANLIKDALIECAVIAPDETVQPDMLADAQRKLNMMVKHWQVSGHNLWTATRDSIALANDKGSDTNPYTFGPGGDKTYRPLRFINMRYVADNGIERPMSQISRQEYDDQPLKTSKSNPTLFYYDPQLGTGLLHIWPLNADGAGGTLKYTYTRTLEDFISNSNTPDFPQEWYEPLMYGLASRLIASYRPQDAVSIQRLQMVAAQSLSDALAYDVEPVSIYVRPDRRARR